ncbi:5-formyltetrahydrofolate cyclo-ligase [Corynebacterium uterequi]|nr:5-formyltetrahydrofolate cyclo-ligase [Corynebacterium uterequi]
MFPEEVIAAKRQARRHYRHRRQHMTAAHTRQSNAALVSRLDELLSSWGCADLTVAAYAPLATEPGGAELLPALDARCETIYLPVTGDDGHMRWAVYAGPDSLRTSALGIAEPTGPTRGHEVLAGCHVLFVPAYAVTSFGVRLGKGGGYYDRALASLGNLDESVPGTDRPLIAVVLFDGETNAQVAVEAHDLGVDVALTPGGVVSFRDLGT